MAKASLNNQNLNILTLSSFADRWYRARRILTNMTNDRTSTNTQNRLQGQFLMRFLSSFPLQFLSRSGSQLKLQGKLAAILSQRYHRGLKSCIIGKRDRNRIKITCVNGPLRFKFAPLQTTHYWPLATCFWIVFARKLATWSTRPFRP